MSPPASHEINLEDIDFDKVRACRDKHVIKRYIKLLEDDGSYFTDLLKACKEQLLEVAPKEYYLLYPVAASDKEVDDATQDLLDWEESVKATDAALLKSKKDNIWNEAMKPVRQPVRGQEPVAARANIALKGDESRPKPSRQEDAYARDRTSMKDYYSAWDKVDVDKIEEEMEREEREAEEAKQRHFDELRNEQEAAQVCGSIETSGLPDGVPQVHKKHLADNEKEKGNEAFYAKDYDEAEAYYTRSIHFKPDDPSTWANRALVRLKLNRSEDALEDCEHSLALNPRYMKALHRRGKALHELGRYEEAVRAFQLALAESPGNTQINGDLMVARRKLRSEGPGSATEPTPSAGRVIGGRPGCCIEELDGDDDVQVAAPKSGPAAGYTRVQIEEDSDSEEEEEVQQGASGGAAPAASQGFRKVVIEEVSGSEDEDEETAPLSASMAARKEEDPAPPRAPGAAEEEPVVCFDDMD